MLSAENIAEKFNQIDFSSLKGSGTDDYCKVVPGL